MDTMTIHKKEFKIKEYVYHWDGVKFKVGTLDVWGLFSPVLRGPQNNKYYIVPKSYKAIIFATCDMVPYGLKNKLFTPILSEEPIA